MAEFSIDIADADVVKVLDAFAYVYNRPEDSEESLAKHANRRVREYIQNIVTQAAVEAAQALVAQARDESVITITDPALVVEGGE